MGKVNKFQEDCWYRLEVFSAWAPPPLTGLGRYQDSIQVVFLVSEPGWTGDSNSPKASMSILFNPDGTPAETGDERLREVLGIPVPIPHDVDWEQFLKGRPIEGQFETPPRAGTRNSLKSVRSAAPSGHVIVPNETGPRAACPAVPPIVASSPAIIMLSEQRFTQPVVTRLALEPLPQGRTSNLVARMILTHEHSIITKDIGERQLFFTHLLVEAGRPLTCNGEEWTVVDYAQVKRTFMAWAENGYLAGAKKDKIKLRIAQNWDGFIRSIKSHPTIRQLFHCFEEPSLEIKLFGVHLSPNQLTNRLPKIAELLKPRECDRDPMTC
jgi:hypothetical protein